MSRTTTLERSLEILVPEAWSTDQKGKFLEDIASQILKRQSYEIESRIRFTGMEIDLLATHKPSSDRIYTECKFHSASIGANVIDLMIGQGFRRNISRLCLFSVGPLSKEATGVVDDLKSDGRVSFSFYGANEILEALLNSGAAPELPEKIVSPAISHATLIVHPECPYLWVLQEQKDGRPYRIIPFSSSDDRPSSSSLRVLLDKHQILEGLPISEYPDKSNSSPLLPADPSSGPAEVVGKVTTADTILDYRPCRPEDFVGRQVLQKEIWDFLGDIRQGTTNTRLIALVGASGYGKSSLVSKLSERFRNIKWKDKFYLYPVDVRSARGPLFVAEALLEAIRSAGDAGFVKVPENLEVTDADNIMSSTSILHFLDQIKSENKVLVVFFDQFEEAFTKDELLPVFRVFRRFSLDVQSLGSNLVVGFSWRTGVSFSDDNPAYQLWNELRDHRLTKTLGKFDSAESSALVSQFEKALGVKLLTPLRRRILEQSQGLPWLLKKLCIHIYRQIESGTSQTALLQSRLNVQTLFDDDLEHISETQLSCLKFIAKNSPADSLEVFDKYGSDTVGALVEKRLVIRAGQKFAVYWDIFRDYLAEGKVPAIPWTYIPNCTIRMAFSVCNYLGIHGRQSVSEMAKGLTYSESTIVNIVTDLQNFALTEKNGDIKFLAEGMDIKSIFERVRSQLIEHIVYHLLLQNLDESKEISFENAREVTRGLYASNNVKVETMDGYLKRLIPWMEIAGLVEMHGNKIKVFGTNKIGSKYGLVADSRRKSGSVFMGAAMPKDAENLFLELCSKAFIEKEQILARKLRNAMQDLVALGLARLEKDKLLAAKTDDIVDKKAIFLYAVKTSPAICFYSEIMAENPHLSRSRAGEILSLKLGKNWKPASCLRYINGLINYIALLSDSKIEGKQLSFVDRA